MLILQKGSFLGNITHLYNQNGATVSVTGYNNNDSEASCEHYHEHPNLYFILEEEVLRKKTNTENEQFAGNLNFYFAGEHHQNIRKVFPSRSVNIELEYSLLKTHNLTEEKIKALILSRPDAKFIFLKILKELLMNDKHSAITINMLILELINQFNTLPNIFVTPKWVQNLHALLHDCCEENLSLIELSKAVQKHPVTISKFFPIYFHCTLGEYMRKLKIEKAIGQIKYSSKSLTSISYDCGFADQSHFIRTFRDLIGVSPKQYQRY